MPASRTVTDDEILSAAAELEAKGDPITGPRLRRELGTGRGDRLLETYQALTGRTQATSSSAIVDLDELERSVRAEVDTRLAAILKRFRDTTAARAEAVADVRLAELRKRIGELETEAVVSQDNLDRADRHAFDLTTRLKAEIADRTVAETQLATARTDLRTQAAAHEASLAASQALVADLRTELELEREARRRAEAAAITAEQRAAGTETGSTWLVIDPTQTETDQGSVGEAPAAASDVPGPGFVYLDDVTPDEAAANPEDDLSASGADDSGSIGEPVTFRSRLANAHTDGPAPAIGSQ